MDIEKKLAERIANMLRCREWSQNEFASRLQSAGYPIHQSAISKILSPPSGEARRKITVTELIGFSDVLGCEASELLGELAKPSVIARRERIRELVTELDRLT